MACSLTKGTVVHTENEQFMYQQWLNELQITCDTLRGERDEYKTYITELENRIKVLSSMVDRLQIAVSQGREL